MDVPHVVEVRPPGVVAEAVLEREEGKIGLGVGVVEVPQNEQGFPGPLRKGVEPVDLGVSLPPAVLQGLSSVSLSQRGAALQMYVHHPEAEAGPLFDKGPVERRFVEKDDRSPAGVAIGLAPENRADGPCRRHGVRVPQEGQVLLAPGVVDAKAPPGKVPSHQKEEAALIGHLLQGKDIGLRGEDLLRHGLHLFGRETLLPRDREVLHVVRPHHERLARHREDKGKKHTQRARRTSQHLHRSSSSAG